MDKTKRQLTIKEFLSTSNIYPLTEGGRMLPGIGRAIPPDIELVDLKSDPITNKRQGLS